MYKIPRASFLVRAGSVGQPYSRALGTRERSVIFQVPVKVERRGKDWQRRPYFGRIRQGDGDGRGVRYVVQRPLQRSNMCLDGEERRAGLGGGGADKTMQSEIQLWTPVCADIFSLFALGSPDIGLPGTETGRNSEGLEKVGELALELKQN